jgi:hypothetical protein
MMGMENEKEEVVRGIIVRGIIPQCGFFRHIMAG